MARTKKKLGNQNPTQSVILPYTKKKSLYKEAIDIYERTGLSSYPWQQNLLKAIMAVDKTGVWVHQKFGYSIPRRNGKSEILYILELWGLEHGLNMLHTAHRISTSHSSFEKVKRYLEKMGYEDGEDFKDIFLDNENYFDFIIIDEAQEYTTEQESALKYTVTDSDNPMTIMCGTPPTPVSSGTVFTKYREACLFGKGKYSGWAEWSVNEEKEIDDVEAWYNSNPSMGFHLNERKIEAELGEDKLDHNVQRLGFWPTYNQKSAISETEWNALEVEEIPKLSGRLFVGIKYGQDGTNVSMSIAVRTADKRIFIETIDCQSVRNGNHWIVAFLKQADVSQIVVDGASGQKVLDDELKDYKIKNVILPTVKEIITANSLWEQGIYQHTICHNGQPSLAKVATNCDKRNIGSNGGFGYRSHFSDMDISLMDSALLAHWACVTTKPKKKQKISY